MRTLLVAAALAAGLAVPAAAQPPRPSDEIRSYAPAMDRMADALLNLDLGPLLDAADPGRRHYDRTLGDMARRDDPAFDRRLRGSIYGTTAAMGRMADAFAAAAPALQAAADRLRMDMAEAIAAVPPGPPPGDLDDDWDRDLDDDAPAPEPYDN